MSLGDQSHVGQRLISLLLGPGESTEIATGDKSIYSRLKKYFGEPDNCLDPSPDINSVLSELVTFLQGVPRVPGFYQGTQFSVVEREVCAEIDRTELLLSRASAIRAVAIRAESQLEFFWTRCLVKSTSIPDPSLQPIEKITLGSGDFPYTKNYLSMVQTEAQVIRCYQRETSRLEYLRERPCQSQQNEVLRIAFCGSGPLPLTGILLAVCLDANVTLIDNDQQAVDLSRQLIENWEVRGIIDHGRVNVVCADGGKVRFCKSGEEYDTRSASSVVRSVRCDVLFVAALIPNATKEEIAQNVSEMGDDGPLLVLRTAHGLTARFAYFQNRRHVMTRYLDFVGLVAPAIHEIGDGYMVDDDVRPIEFFSEDILNSLELYRWKKR